MDLNGEWNGKVGGVPVDHVNYTIVDENVWSNHLSGIDENTAVLNGDRDVGSVDGLERGIAEDAAISHCTLHYVVFNNAGQLLSAKVSNRGPDGLECSVGRCEYCDIG